MVLRYLVEEIVESCKVYQQVNACHNKVGAGKTPRENRLGVFWKVDFTEVKPRKYGHKYLLVFVDTLSGWVEDCPTGPKMAPVVAKKILEEIFPKFGVPKVIGSNNGPDFFSQVSQRLEKVLGTDWKLHCVPSTQAR